MIEIKHIYKRFGSQQVLDNASLTLDKGTIFGLIGINVLENQHF